MRKKILFLCEHLPCPLGTGVQIRTYNLLKALCKDHDVTLLAMSSNDEPNEDKISELCREVIIVPSRIIDSKSFMVLIKSLLNLRPYFFHKYWNQEFSNRLSDLLQNKKFDMVHCAHLWVVHYIIQYIKMFKKVKYTLDHHNIETVMWGKMADLCKNHLKKFLLRKQLKKVYKYEKGAIEKASQVLTVSVQDKVWILKNTNQKKVHVIENGVDLEYFVPKEVEVEPNSMVFVGSMDWFPNNDGITRFYKDVWPKLKKKIPGIKIYVVGRNPSEQLKSFAKEDESFIVTGFVEDVRPFIYHASLYVVPLYVSGGTRLKIIEAFAMKKCVISTSLGAEGIEHYDGESILIARDDEHFVNTIATCLTKQNVMDIIQDRAFELARSKYNWKKIGRKFSNTLT